ncbi:MAG: four helix bundle protein [Patescibacteria group bacterium]|nr:four helix bundle protein [Patescibacteria group bacterium]
MKFSDLEIWKIGFKSLSEIYALIKNFPKFEQFALASQSIRSANSIIANIAEAHGRYFFNDKIRILYIARAEAEEVQSHLMVACSQEYISKEIANQLIERYEVLIKKINSYISYLSQKRPDSPINR